jgi:tRNA nucleotidyltransferase (CCA-adding enzyme)
MNISEETFTSCSQGPGKTEAEKCENAVSAVRKATAADNELAALDISVSPQGSYLVRTNIRQDSDVDICVRYNSAFFPEYPEGKTSKDFGLGDSTLTYADFKNKVERALLRLT